MPRDKLALDDLWDDLRQGSRNVAGVNWQVAVSVHLLVLARVGDLPIASMTPEGFEDLDCIAADGTRTFVQTKEASGGEGRLTASDVGDVLKHAEDAARGAQIVLVTDGELGSGLGFTGWDGFLSGQPPAAVDSVVSILRARGFDGPTARGVVARSRVVRLPWRLRDLTERRLADVFGAHPTVAAFVVDLLCAEVAASAANQRAVARANARTHTVADVDAAVARVQSAVDLAGLDAAVAAGVCAPADFLAGSDLTPVEFFAGVDGSPAHIAARLDVPRPQVDEIRSASQRERYALLVGPSGSGKSVLLWRAARDAVPGARVVRVRRLRTIVEADLLVRHVRLLQPSLTAPVVVAADDLGRPPMAAWPDAASDLRDGAGVFLLGACRAEDFRPSLISGPTRVIEPALDNVTAHAVAVKVESAGVPLTVTADEAAAMSGGLLMEFLALLTTGTRLEQVLAGQADDLRQPGRELQREAARMLTTAHSFGLGVDADRLGQALAGGDPSNVGDALAVLQDEHVILANGSSWTGLHELRSRTLARLLHESPPPTLTATIARTIALLNPPEAGWLLRRVAEHDSADVPSATRAAAMTIAHDGITADDAAVLLEGAERADNAVYARMCKPILDKMRPPGVTLHHLALMAYSVRNQGAVYSTTGSPQLDKPFMTIEAIGRSLPARPAAATTAVAAGISPERLSELVVAADLPSVVRLLEAGAGLLPVTAELGRSLLRAHPASHLAEQSELWPRLVEALHDALTEDQHSGALGSVEDRALSVARSDPLVIGLTVAPSSDEATVTLLLPQRAARSGLPVWDSAAPSDQDDLANSTAVAAARRLAAACRELKTVEVVTMTPSGRRYRVGDHEPGYKRMPTASAFPDRTSVRRNVGFQSALRRLSAAESWTSVLRQQIAVGKELADLVAEAPARLSSRDNQGRRRAWSVRAAAAVVAVGELAARPALTGVDPAQSHARADDEQRRSDPAADALAHLANALPQIAEDGRLLPLAFTFRDAADKLAAAAAAGAPALSGLGSPIPDRLVHDCRRLAGALAALNEDSSGALRIRATDPLGSADRLAADAAERTAEREHAVLTDHLGKVADASIKRVQNPSPPAWAVDATGWVIFTPVEQWDELCRALTQFPEVARRDLAGRVVAAACVGQRALLTARLTSFGDQALLPLTPEAARPMVEAAGLVMAEGAAAASMSQVIDHLVALSWQTARDRARPHDWPALDPDPALTLDRLESEAEIACARLQELDAQAARWALAVLLNQVERELGSPQPITLAGVVFDIRNPSASPGDSTELLTALAQINLLALAAPPSNDA
jgi:hypothetical protein